MTTSAARARWIAIRRYDAFVNLARVDQTDDFNGGSISIDALTVISGNTPDNRCGC